MVERKGVVTLDNRILERDATIDAFVELMKSSYEGNNYVYKVEIELEPQGPKPIELILIKEKYIFTSAEGFVQDQKQRKGTLEVFSDLAR